MARLIRQLDEELYVQHGQLCIYGGTDCPEFSDDESETYHANVPVHLEAWDAEPPELGPDWRPIERTSFTAVTGVTQMGVWEGSGHDFLIGPPLFEYGLTVHVHDVNFLRWLFRFWPIRDVFDPLAHMRPRELGGSAPPLESRQVPVPVTTAGQWAALRPDKHRPSQGSVRWADTSQGLLGADPIARMFNLHRDDHVSRALNPDHAPTFLIPSHPLHEELDLRDREPGHTCRMWRWERETADGKPEDGNLLTGRIVHVRDVHGRRVLASGIVTILGTEAERHHVRDAEPHEAARVVCSEETWSD